MTRRADWRASDADREQVAERLRHATTEGRLLPDELEDRLGAALSARTYGELDAIVSDLPAPSPARTGASRALVPVRPAVAVAAAVVVAFILIGALTAVAGVHSHAGHHAMAGGRGFLPIVWLIWIAIGWRLLARRSRSHRS